VRTNRFFRAGMAGFMALLVLAMFPYTGDPTGDIKNLIISWAACVLGSAWLVTSWRSKQPFRPPRFFLAILLISLALNLIAALRSDYVAYGLIEVRRFGALFLLYLVASQVYRTPQQVRHLMFVLCCAVLVAAVYAFFQKAGLDFFPWADRTSDEYLNLPATFGNPNYAAHTLILAIIMAVYLAMKKNRLWYLGFAAVFLVHLYFTRQRAGILALLAAALLVAVSKLMNRIVKRPLASAAASLLVVGILGVVGLSGIMAITKVRTGNVYPLDLSLLVRYKSYCSASRMILERPILGYGPGAYKIENPRFWTPYEQDWFARELKMNAHVHNDPLEIAIDAGLPAAALYLAFLILGMGYGILMGYTRRDPAERRLGFAFAALFAAFLVDGCFGFNLRVPVSATILFVTAGAMEGLGLPLEPSPHAASLSAPAVAWRAAVVALAAWCAVLDSLVFTSEVYLQLGKRQVYRRTYGAAQALFTRGEALAPWNWRFAQQLGLVSLAIRDFKGAATHLERALEKNPQYIVTMVALARAKMWIGVAELSHAPPPSETVPESTPALDEAAAYAERALGLCPKFAQAEETLGRLASARATQLAKKYGPAEPPTQAIQETWARAETHLSRAIQFGAQNQGELYRLLARAHLGLGDEDGAEQALIRSAQANPADEVTWPYFYEFAKRLGRFDQLRHTLLGQVRRMRETPGFDPDAIAGGHLWLATVYESGYDDADGAERAYREAVRWAPLRPDVWSTYARFAARTGRNTSFATALAASCKGLEAEGKAPLPEAEAVALVQQRGPEALGEAAKLLGGALDDRFRADRGATARKELAWAADLLLAEAQNAPAELEEIGSVFLGLGMFYARIGELIRADELYAKALPNLWPTEQSICALHWAQVLTRLHRTTQAINILRQTLQHDPDNLSLRLSLARTYARAGMPGQACATYQQMLESPDLDEDSRRAVERELRRTCPPQDTNADP